MQESHFLGRQMLEKIAFSNNDDDDINNVLA